MSYDEYQKDLRRDIGECLQKMASQPILFAGSGLSRRYFGGPSWDGLLEELAKKCPAVPNEYAYYRQKHASLIDIGSELASLYREWAWGDGRKTFDTLLFASGQPAEIYIKASASKLLDDRLKSSAANKLMTSFDAELSALKAIRPHAVITTNYDAFLEKQFPDYTVVIGEQVIRADWSSVGEILKIHGSSSTPNSLVLTRADYDQFSKKKKYLSAKLLTFFSEHPLIFVGYSASDPNIVAILSDIDEILAPVNGLIPNIYLVEWMPDADAGQPLPRERVIDVGGGRSVRIKCIVAKDFEWVFNAFSANEAIEAVNPKILRALMARTYKLVRSDIPRKTFEVKYETLEHAVNEEGGMAKLFGITTLDDPSAVNAMYPFSLTRVGELLGYKGWNAANALIAQVIAEREIDIKSSDNRYHMAVVAGSKTKNQIHKYSQAAVDLLAAVRDGKPYQVKLS